MIEVICAAVILWGDSNPNSTDIPPLVHGTLVGEMIDSNGKEYFKVKFKDLLRRKRILYFEANTCKVKGGIYESRN